MSGGFVRAAIRSTRGLRVTGDVLHLAVFVLDPDQRTRYGGRHVPLCGGSPLVEAWKMTGERAAGWARHEQQPICRRCQRKAGALLQTIGEHERRGALGGRS